MLDEARIVLDWHESQAAAFTKRVLSYLEKINFRMPAVSTVPSGAIYLGWDDDDNKKMVIVIDRDGSWYRLEFDDHWQPYEKYHPTTDDILDALAAYDRPTYHLFEVEPGLKAELPV